MTIKCKHCGKQTENTESAKGGRKSKRKINYKAQMKMQAGRKKKK